MTMNSYRSIALYVLRAVVAVVCGWGAVQLLHAVAGGHGPHLPHVVLQTIAVAEIVAAILFLVPNRLGRFGGHLLLFVLLTALLVHLLHRDYGVVNLIVYAAAVWAVLASERDRVSSS